MSGVDGGVLLRLDGLTAGYRQPVVGPLSLALRRGERLGVWGPNGTGKSTLLKAIGHAAQVFAGRVERAPGLRVAYLDQQPVRLPAMPITGRELLRAAGATTRGAPEALEAILRRRIDRLSGGQYQLLWIWSALATDADLVLLDEPTNNLDPGRRDRLIEILTTRHSDQALILVSHDRDFLQRTCSHLLDLENGEVKHA
ncbi:ABC transporter ATP-binding protein [Thiorhodococcus mannitoliphagus]|uniref:ABC transporter ATP-binding protein n=1 Tax=Thiorhodococcus mannitoliphagus TaxID=329406 RepID=A0A6P1E1G4_9GAMM|nr:ABC transporter ATP-binding protein [Thiorhodococcus mannitoliphagus]NEX23073.1 ABC transporter ATP-binding protein [Thiorhodococcus mannitoliphagus]